MHFTFKPISVFLWKISLCYSDNLFYCFCNVNPTFSKKTSLWSDRLHFDDIKIKINFQQNVLRDWFNFNPLKVLSTRVPFKVFLCNNDEDIVVFHLKKWWMDYGQIEHFKIEKLKWFRCCVLNNYLIHYKRQHYETSTG